MDQLGDYALGRTIDEWFPTIDPTGAPLTLTGSPLVRVYKDASTTESSAGVSLTVDVDNRTGLHHVAVDTSADGSFYSAGSNFCIVLIQGTVNGVNVAPMPLAQFSLVNQADSAGVTTLLSRLTSTRAGLLDNLDVALSVIAGYIDTEIAAIKAKTDNLPATPASQGDVNGVPAAVLAAAASAPIAANAKQVNDVDLTGNGTVSTPWGPA